MTTDPDRQPIPNEPPANWQFETPRYRVTREIHPAEKRRFRLETPFSNMSNSDAWQYGERTMKAGEVIATREWPHPSFHPLNFGAKKVLEFFNSGIKSRMARSPWQGDRIVLQDGVTSSGAPVFVARQLKQMDLRPVS